MSETTPALSEHPVEAESRVMRTLSPDVAVALTGNEPPLLPALGVAAALIAFAVVPTAPATPPGTAAAPMTRRTPTTGTTIVKATERTVRVGVEVGKRSLTVCRLCRHPARGPDL